MKRLVLFLAWQWYWMGFTFTYGLETATTGYHIVFGVVWVILLIAVMLTPERS